MPIGGDWIDKRFGGVVGYRICLTHRRPPVRARAESFCLLSRTDYSRQLRGNLLASEAAILTHQLAGVEYKLCALSKKVAQLENK